MLTSHLNWLKEKGKEDEIVLSSRVRLARNINGFPFEIKLNESKEIELLELLKTALGKVIPGRFIDIMSLTPLEVQALLEQHLISPAFIQSEHKKALFLSDDGYTSTMINEEDHLRIQAIKSGLSLNETYQMVNQLESQLDEEVEFAFDEEFGYISSCPTNLGTGLRASLFFHLPALILTREAEKVLRGIYQIGLAVRGIFGEGSETKGHLFQISNRITLGQKEEETLEIIEKVAYQLIDFEKKARMTLLEKAKAEIEDKIFRAEAILKSARTISTDEAINLISAVRLGIGLGYIKGVSIQTLNEILIFTRPANLQIIYDKPMDSTERDVKRAEYIRGRFAQGNHHQ